MSFKKLAFSALRTVSITSLVSGAALAALSASGCAEQNDKPSMHGEKGCGGDKKCGGDAKTSEKKGGGEMKCGGDSKCGGSKK